MNKNIGESHHESQDDSRWNMSEVAPFRQENDSGQNTENLERDPSLVQQEKAKELHEARKQVEDAYCKMAPTEIVPTTPLSTPTLEQPASSRNSVGQVLKRTAIATGSLALSVASVSAMVLAPVSVPLLFPAAVLAADSILYNIRGVNGSMFEVNRKNKITQRINPLPVLMKYRGKDSAEIFKEETTKLFDGLKSGETYSTRSHAVTYSMLRLAQREGKITDLNREKSGESRLILENIVTGNWKALKNNKKHDMYNISFKMV